MTARLGARRIGQERHSGGEIAGAARAWRRRWRGNKARTPADSRLKGPGRSVSASSSCLRHDRGSSCASTHARAAENGRRASVVSSCVTCLPETLLPTETRSSSLLFLQISRSELKNFLTTDCSSKRDLQLWSKAQTQILTGFRDQERGTEVP